MFPAISCHTASDLSNLLPFSQVCSAGICSLSAAICCYFLQFPFCDCLLFPIISCWFLIFPAISYLFVLILSIFWHFLILFMLTWWSLKSYLNYLRRTIPTNFNRGGYRRRILRRQWLGSNWRYIARELYRRILRRQWLGGSWRYIAGGLCRGGEAEE